MTSLVSERLRLTPLARGDRELLLAHFRRPDVRRWLWDDRIVEPSDVDEVIERSERSLAAEGRALFRLELRESGAFAGVAGLTRLPGADAVELLYSLEPAHWGRGLATEAAARLLEHAFVALGLPRVIARADAPNEASQRVMRRLGMRFEREMELNGLPHVQYALDAESWRRGRAPAC